jgi:plastocyanin
MKHTSALVLAGALVLVGGGTARAGSLKGTIAFPADPRSPDARPLAFWRVENGRVPIAPLPAESRAAAIVVLEPDPPPPEKTPTVADAKPPRSVVEIKGLKLEPRVVVAPVGTLFEFKNSDKVIHTLYLAEGESFMPREPIAPGKSREVKLSVAGDYQVRDAEYPHAKVTLLVVATPHHTRADEHGGFQFEAPPGKYTVRSWWHGVWSAPQTVEVGKTNEVLLRFAGPAK